MARYRFRVSVTLTSGDMTSGQGHDTPSSYGPETDFGYVCTVTLTLEVAWVKVMTHPWVMNNNYVKYYPDPTEQWGVMARARILGMCLLCPLPWIYDIW